MAAGWERRNGFVSAAMRPVTERLLDALEARPGNRVLEVGAGLGDVGEAVAPRVAPDGEVLLTDVSPEMLQAAERRLGQLPNARFAIADAMALDFPDGSFDRAVSRFALMLVTDPAAAFAGLRRVLRPAGRLAFAVWAAAEDNPWVIAPTLVRLGFAEASEPGAPGPFRLADAQELRELVTASNFESPRLETVDLTMRYDSLGHYWAVSADMSFTLKTTLERLPAREVERLRRGVAEHLAPYGTDAGLEIPGRAWVGAADVPPPG